MDPHDLVPAPIDVDTDLVDDQVARHVRDAQTPAPTPGWTIENVGQADWAMARLAAIHATVQEYTDQAQLWADSAKRLARAGDWYEDRLADWALRSRTDTRKSFPLPHGHISTTGHKAKVIVTDEPAAVAWALEHCPDAVKTTQTLLVSQLPVLQVVEMCARWAVYDRETGERATDDLVTVPLPVSPTIMGNLSADLGGDRVEPVDPWLDAVADDGGTVPGLGVKPASVTVSVKPARA